jgi:hypothetical protein
VAVFDRGELQSVRILSLRRERWAASLAAATGGLVMMLVMAAAAGVVTGFDRVVHGPTFLLVWLAAAATVGGVFASWARRRLGRYRLGADIEADAFAMADIDLIRRSGEDYEIGLCLGMTGAFEHRHSALPLEGFVRAQPVYLPLPAAGRVRVEVGTSTFIITRKAAGSGGAFPLREWAAWLATGPMRQLLRGAVLASPVAVLVTMLGAVPAAHAVDIAEPGFGLRADHDPLERASRLWRKAQHQTASLHQCFEPLPRDCQRSGFVAVGLELTRRGEVTSHWIARTSYGDDCPVTACMENVVASWSFEPMSDPLRVVIPIEVTRTPRAAPGGEADEDPSLGQLRLASSFVDGTITAPDSRSLGWPDSPSLVMDMSDGGTTPGAGCRDSQ